MLVLEHTSLDPFEPQILSLYDSLFSRGFDGLKSAGLNFTQIWHTEAYRMFKAACLPDFINTQITLGWKILELEEKILSLKNNEKKLRLNREIEEADHVKKLRLILEKRQLVFRRLLDSILWTLVWPQKWILRRYRVEGGIRNIDIKTTEPLLKTIEKSNDGDNSFSLICDLTTVAQLGDLIIFKWDPKKNVVNSLIAELKIGSQNVLLGDLLKDTDENKIDNTLSKLAKSNPHLEQQAKRFLRQKARLKNFENIISKDEGVHPMTGTKLIFHDSIPAHDYRPEIYSLISMAKLHGSYGLTLDTCLRLFATSNDDQNDPNRQLKFAAIFYDMKYGKFCGTEDGDIEALFKMPKILNLFEQCMSIPIAMPPFLWYPKKIVMDLLAKRIKIFAQFDYEDFFKLASNHGIKMSFVTGKMAQKIKDAKMSNPLIEYQDQRYIKYENSNGTSSVSGARLFSRVYTEVVRPYSKLLNIINSLEFNENDRGKK